MSGRGQVMLKITLTLILTLTYTRPPMFDRLQRRHNSRSVLLFVDETAENVCILPYFILFFLFITYMSVVCLLSSHANCDILSV